MKNIFDSRPKLHQYARMDAQAREVADFTIQNYLKSNLVLRLPGIFRTKNIKIKNADLWSWKWIDLLELRQAIEDNNFAEVFRLTYGVSEYRLLRADVFNVFAAYKWIIDNVNEISKIEADRLASEMTAEEKAAGADALQELGYTVAVDSLANGNLLKHNEILKKRYSIIFRQLVLMKTKSDITKSYNENASRKNRAGRIGA